MNNLNMAHVLGLIVTTWGLSGCALYSVAGQFEDTGQDFYGNVMVSPVDIGTLDVTTADGKIVCSGSTQVTRRGSLMSNVGAQGHASATCNDGRTFKIDFIQASESGGHGQGIDDRGNIVKVFFDMSSSAVRARLDQNRLNDLVQ